MTIFTQAAQALRQPESRILGGLPIQQVIGTGVSQSAMRLVPYINAFHPLAHVCTTGISSTVADGACHRYRVSACFPTSRQIPSVA